MVAALPALAQSTGSVLRDVNLLKGSWAADCRKPRSVNNWYGTYVAKANGEGQLVYDSGEGTNIYRIVNARALSPNEMLMTQEFVREKRFLEIVIKVEGDRLRTLSVKRPDGTFQVKDGKFTGAIGSSGHDSPWLHRCR